VAKTLSALAAKKSAPIRPIRVIRVPSLRSSAPLPAGKVYGKNVATNYPNYHELKITTN